MCRSAAQGGRRCSGRGRATTATILDATPAARDAQDKAAARSGGSVPTREQADQLAAALPADRTDGFGQTLSEKDRRFFALRESGYTGPIDPDGYPDTTSRGADVLRHMARDRGETVNW